MPRAALRNRGEPSFALRMLRIGKNGTIQVGISLYFRNALLKNLVES